MKLTLFAIKKLTPLVIGGRSGPKLAELFNEFGCRDIYDYNNGGLPINPSSTSGHSYSRTQYTENRLASLQPHNLRLLVERILLEAVSKDLLAPQIDEIISPEGIRSMNRQALIRFREA